MSRKNTKSFTQRPMPILFKINTLKKFESISNRLFICYNGLNSKFKWPYACHAAMNAVISRYPSYVHPYTVGSHLFKYSVQAYIHQVLLKASNRRKSKNGWSLSASRWHHLHDQVLLLCIDASVNQHQIYNTPTWVSTHLLKVRKQVAYLCIASILDGQENHASV